jgi:hypothetical protein
LLDKDEKKQSPSPYSRRRSFKKSKQIDANPMKKEGSQKKNKVKSNSIMMNGGGLEQICMN